jgi:site-specific recombinase XerC
MNELALFAAPDLPALLTAAEPRTQTRFWEFFAAQIRNRHTRRAYSRATGQFLLWCEKSGVSAIREVQPLHVAAYIEQLGRERSAPTVKQHLAAIRHLFDWLVTGQVMPQAWPSALTARVARIEPRERTQNRILFIFGRPAFGRPAIARRGAKC